MTKNALYVSHKKSKQKLQDGSPKLPEAAVMTEGEIAVNFAKGVETLSIKNESGNVTTFSCDDYYTSKKLGDDFTGSTTVTDAISALTRTKQKTIAEGRGIAITTGATADTVSFNLPISGGSGDFSIIEGYSTIASGSCSHAEGDNTEANGDASHAEGESTIAGGNSSHAEGSYTKARGESSHAEGDGTKASGFCSHAEGSSTTASGDSSHAEGYDTTASGDYSHAEGLETIASGQSSHAEGDSTKANGESSHAEGSYTKASGFCSHAEGSSTTASGASSHAEGSNTTASGFCSHAEGFFTDASGEYSHAEGYYTEASGSSSHAEGYYTIASNDSEHASGQFNVSNKASTDFGDSGNTLFSVGNGTARNARHNAFEIRQNGDIYIVSGSSNIKLQDNLGADLSNYYTKSETSGATEISTALNAKQKTIVEGRGITVTSGETADTISLNLPISGGSGDYSIIEGYGTKASGESSHAEGVETRASGQYSHAEGAGTTASGPCSHAEGASTIASGIWSHAEGSDTTASGDYSHAEGRDTIASNESEHASGQFNVSSSASTSFGDSGNTLFSVGNGTATNARHNAFEIRQNGDIYIVSGSSNVKLQDNLGTDLSNYYTKSQTSGATEISTALNAKQKTIAEGRGITVTSGETADTVSLNLPIYSGSGSNSIKEGSYTTASGDYSHAEGYYTDASGDYSHAEGLETMAAGNCSHAEGYSTTASSYYSHTEGYYTTASGYSSHAEGSYTNASGNYSHAEGQNTTASGQYSHAEGDGTTARGESSHAEGVGTIASNESEHASGQYNVSSSASTTFGNSGNTLFSVGNGRADNARHNAFEIRQNGDIYIVSGSSNIKLQDNLGADLSNYYTKSETSGATEISTALNTKQKTIEGGRGISIASGATVDTVSFNLPISGGSGTDSITEGSDTKASGDYSHAEGENSRASGYSSHAEGYGTTARGDYSHAEGLSTAAIGTYSHAEGGETAASGSCSHAEGNNTTASGDSSHAEGSGTTASGKCSHAEGYGTTARGNYSHAEGLWTIASGSSSHAEGSETKASGSSSHAEGQSSRANGNYSHAEGAATIAYGTCSHAEGYYTEASNDSEHASGQFNTSNKASSTFGDSGNTLFSVGNGTADNARHNAFEVRQNGDIYIVSGSSNIKLQDNLGTDLSNYYTKSETSGKSEISTALSLKADTATTYTKSQTSGATEISTALASKVNTATTVNGYALSSNVSLTASDVGACANNDSRLSDARVASNIKTSLLSKSTNYSITSDDTFVLSEYLRLGNTPCSLTIAVKNTGSTDIAVTVPTSFYWSSQSYGADVKTPDGQQMILTCPAGGYCEVNFAYFLGFGYQLYARGI